MSIKRNLDKTNVAVVIDTFKGGSLGRQLRTAAVSAVTGGMNSEDWKSYMSLFADNADELRRLTVEDEAEPDYFKISRAYIVSNAICGAETTTQTGANVDGGFFAGVPEAPDGSIVKLFDIPDVP